MIFLEQATETEMDEQPIRRRQVAATTHPDAKVTHDDPRMRRPDAWDGAGDRMHRGRSGPGFWSSDGYDNRETWRRILAAHVQILVDAAD
jgi:hypothetical protein